MRRIFAGTLLPLLIVQQAAAAVWTNTITTAPQNWNVAANWTAPATIPNGNGAVAWITNDITGNQIINLSGPITIGLLTLGDSNGTDSFTIAANGSTLTFQNNGGAASLTQTATSRGDTLATDAMLADSLTIRNDSANPITITGNISGAGGLAVIGPGTLVLAGNNTYAGSTFINSTTVRLRGGVVQSPVPGYARWFDASTASNLTTIVAGLVTQWNDLSPIQAHATPQTGHSPSYVSSALNGLGAIHFGPGPAYNPASSDSLNFYEDTSIRTVFSIFKGSSFLITDTNAYDFHRPNDTDPAAPLWVGAPNNWTSANIRNGATYVNGILLDGTAVAMPTNANNGFNLVEVVSTGSVSADGFNRDRVYHAGDQWHGELLIYDTVLTEANRLAVEQYLNRKWFGLGGNNTLPADTALTLTGGATLDLSGTCQALRSLSGSTGSVVDNMAPNPTQLSVNGNAISTSFAGVIRNSGGGAMSLAKNGTGTLTLQGANTYSGKTLVNLGTLTVDGSIGPGAVTVSANGTLAGKGTLDGSVILQAGCALSPGSATPGTLTVNGDLICSNGVQLLFALGTNGSRVVVNGSLNLGGTLNISDAGGLGVGTYTLFSGFTSLAWNGPAVGAVPAGYAASFDMNTTGEVKLMVTLSPFRLWQIEYFGDPDSPSAAAGADPDGDGVSNWNEFLAGTNPTNRNSALRLISVTQESGGRRLTWMTAGVRSNVLQVAAEPFDASFNDLSGTIVLPATGDTVTNYLDAAASTNPGPRFYRVREEPRPPLASEERLKWWREARFGMFIHWDPISILGDEISWSRGAQVATNVYDNLYKQFNPTNFNADQWVGIAQSAGMKYMVFTTRHHDGFSMFDTSATNYMSDIGTTNIYKITSPECPFGRDVVKELASACHRAGMRFGAYYSQPDWVFTGSSSAYLDYLKTQVRELMSDYGRVDVLWYDGLGGSAADYDSAALDALARSLQPTLLINNRNGGLAEDFDTPEQTVGAFQNFRAWESCMTISAHNQWAWGGTNDGVKSVSTCLNLLVNCAGGDGNMLLNVGPRPDGIIDPEQANRLRDIGAWLAQYGQSIYGTRGGPFKPGGYGASTYQGSTVYVHILSWVYDPVVLPAIPARVLSQHLIAGGAASVVQTETNIEISVPLASRQATDTILALELDMDASLIPPVDVPLPVSLAAGAAATASNVYQNQADYDATKAVDGNLQTRWATDAGTHQAWLELDLRSVRTFSRVVISEAFDRVQSFQLQWFDGSAWQNFWTGTTIGNQWSQSFPPITSRLVRLNILDASDGPTVWEFQLFQ
ncbi:MAG TPA: alpha-L-fucosidase [Candidatus Binatia bacterium]|nr:alpha-L-fucosidase [Candidatus Binatia bacterium]